MERYVKIRSWHIIRTFTRVPGGAITLCGKRTQGAPMSQVLPLVDRSCETCLRLDQPVMMGAV